MLRRAKRVEWKVLLMALEAASESAEVILRRNVSGAARRCANNAPSQLTFFTMSWATYIIVLWGGGVFSGIVWIIDFMMSTG